MQAAARDPWIAAEHLDAFRAHGIATDEGRMGAILLANGLQSVNEIAAFCSGIGKAGARSKKGGRRG